MNKTKFVGCFECAFMRFVNNDFMRAIKTCTNRNSPYYAERYTEEAITDAKGHLGCEQGEINATPK